MELTKKLEMLGLDSKEEKKAIKFFAALSLVSAEELNDVLEFLKEKGVQITKASEIKVLANSMSELKKTFAILEEIGHEDIFRQDPTMLSRNVIDLHRMIKYYDQNNIPYRDENGAYDLKMFSEEAWKRVANGEIIKSVEEDLVTVEPTIEEPVQNTEITVVEDDTKDTDLVSFSSLDEEKDAPLFQKPEEDSTFNLDELPSYSMYDEPKPAIEKIDDINNKVTDFTDIRKELEDQLKGLENIKDHQNSEISFDDNLSNIVSFNEIEPEEYGMGGR